MIGKEDVMWAVRHCVIQTRLHSCFVGPHRFLGAMGYEDGWVGRRVRLPSGEEEQRGKGYAIRLLDGEDMACRSPEGPVAFGKWVVSIAEEMASALGTEVEKAIRGDARQRSFADAQADAKEGRVAVAVSGFRSIDAPQGFKFMHLCAVPHIVMDDVTLYMPPGSEGVELRMRVFGNVVPVGTRLSDDA